MDHFINQALVFIAATVAFVPLFHRLGFGSVLGYLVAGIIVGPHILGLIHDGEHVLHFAELGVVFLLFIIGLEIQPKKLWGMRQSLIGLGGLQVLICTAVFMAMGLWWGLSPMASAILGFGLSLSSTAFALQTLAEKNQLSTTFGQSSFAILLMQDLLAIPALALIPALASDTGSSSTDYTKITCFVLIIVGLVVASRYLIRPIFRLIASTRSRELFTAATLLIVFGVASLMLGIGLSAALGTFMAGVLLADSEYRHELEANLDPFKSLLMGLFFIAVGMSVSLPLILKDPITIFGLAIGYVLLKMFIIYSIGRAFKLSDTNAKQMALAVGQGGEFAFVIFGIAVTLKLVSTDITGMLTAVITISMALSPLLNMAFEKLAAHHTTKVPQPVYDEIKDESPEVIIAGFGRFGQIFGRMLRSQHIPFVAIDHDANQIELLRKFSNKVYYGDASRLDILEMAGTAKAKYFVIAIDDMEMSLKTAEVIREHFPKIKIFARARNRGHTFELMELGVTHIKRETFDSSVNFVKDLLLAMGHTEAIAQKMIERFKTHDEVMLQEQYKVRSDEKMFVSVSLQGAQQLTEVLKQDREQSYIK